MSVKSLATRVATVAAIAAAASAVSCLATVAPAATAAPVTVFFAPSPASGRYPQPLDPAIADVPAPEQLTGVLNTLADPNVPAVGKSYLIEGGLGGAEAAIMDHKMRKGVQKGKFPLAINVANIAPAGPGVATADVTASGPTMEPRTVNLSFVDQDGWKLSRNSLMTLSQMTSG